MATACAAQACTPSRVSTSVEAKPQQPLAITRMPRPSDSLSARCAHFAIFCGEVAQAHVHHAGIGEGGAAHACAVSSARLVHSCISPTTAETSSSERTTFN